MHMNITIKVKEQELSLSIPENSDLQTIVEKFSQMLAMMGLVKFRKQEEDDDVIDTGGMPVVTWIKKENN